MNLSLVNDHAVSPLEAGPAGPLHRPQDYQSLAHRPSPNLQKDTAIGTRTKIMMATILKINNALHWLNTGCSLCSCFSCVLFGELILLFSRDLFNMHHLYFLIIVSQNLNNKNAFFVIKMKRWKNIVIQRFSLLIIEIFGEWHLTKVIYGLRLVSLSQKM